MKDTLQAGALQRALIQAQIGHRDDIAAKGHWDIWCRDPEGGLIWQREIDNLITTVGLNKILTEALKGSAYTAAWYVGLVDNSGFSAYAAGDTLSSHAGWTEFTSYSGSRKAITFGTASGGVLASSSIPTFTMSGSGTLDGLFVCDAASGTSGTLLSEGAFSGGDAPVGNNYVITATYQLTLASS